MSGLNHSPAYPALTAVDIGAGTIVTQDDLGSAKTINSAAVADTDLDVTITTIAGEDVLFNFSGGIQQITAPGALDSFIFFLKVDSGADEEVWMINDQGNTNYAIQNGSFAQVLHFATSGSHTIKLRACCSASSSWELRSNGTDTTARFQATQYRGGLIPIQEEGVDTVTTPSAINFVGVGSTVTDVGGVATVTIPGDLGTLSRQATGISANTDGSSIVACTTAAITITLDTDHVVTGKVIYIKDEAGDATANPITVDTEGAETIDGAASIQITVDYGVLKVYSDGTNWFTL